MVLGFAALVGFAACSDESSEPDGLCVPGENIFCRCTGGEAGTKACKESGDDFDECLVAPNTTCEDRIECSDADPPIPCLCSCWPWPWSQWRSSSEFLAVLLESP